MDPGAFIAAVEAAARDGERWPPSTIEALDPLGKLRWQAYCSSVPSLMKLASQLRAEQVYDDGG